MKSYYTSLLLAGLFGGCNLLEQEPISNVAATNYYQTPTDALAATTAAYDPLGNLYRDEIMGVFHLVSTDESVPFLTGNADRVALWRFNAVAANSFVNNVWATSYQGVQRCNVAITRISGIAMDEQLKQRYVAEAQFLRALYYFNLVRLFGGVPLVLNESESLEGLNVPRASVEEVYAQIEADLQAAEGMLPVSYTGADLGRATQGAAKAILAKVYLTRAGNDPASPFWAQAAAKANEVIGLGTYDLWTDFADAFRIAGENGKESVFEVQYMTNIPGEGNNFTTGYAPRGAPIVPGTGSGIVRVTKSLFDSFSDQDTRKAVTFLTSYLNPVSGQTIFLTINELPYNPAQAISFRKFFDATSTSSGQAGVNFTLLRYSDILLTYAEALNEASGGPTPDAYAALNRVRQRAGVPEISGLSQSEFREVVLTERRLEFAFEQQRWFDLVRRGRLKQAVEVEQSYGRAAVVQDFQVLFPIPQREVDINPAIGQANQNPGY